MPKVPPGTHESPTTPPTAASSPGSSVLKRNQACHQCRKRKLKCDAQRPCSTCKRSHRNALAHAEPGTVIPPQIDCSYDEVVPTPAPSESGPKSRFEKLEMRMRELEAMVREKEQFTQQLLQQLAPTEHQSANGIPPQQSFLPPQVPAQNGDSTTNLPNRNAPLSPTISPPNPFPRLDDTEMFFPNYPPHLPPPDLLHHLASLSLPPNSIGFPKTSLLHAICAIGSTYTSLVQQPPLPDYKQQRAREIYKDPQRGPSFGEMQAKYAKESLEAAIQSGDGIFEGFQAMLLLSWFNFSQAKWVESWLSTGLALRSLTPLGLNICEPHVPLRRSLAPVFLLPPPRDVIEEETRRNCFWLAYSMERFQTVGTGWAATLDDADVTQVLPTTSEKFLHGSSVPTVIRQRLSTAHVLTNHPPGQTDSFTLYIKAAHLLSVVKSFNHRILSKTVPIQAGTDGSGITGEADVRRTADFASVEQLVTGFALSFARQYRNPVKEGLVDSHLYVASVVSPLSMIVLHAPHVVPNNPTCISSAKVLSSARAILESVYAVCNTSYDFGLLDSFCSMAWVIPAQELVRLARANIDMGNVGHGLQLRADLEVFRLALVRMAERVPLSYRRLLLLEDAIKSELDPILGGVETHGATELPVVSNEQAGDNRAYCTLE